MSCLNCGNPVTIRAHLIPRVFCKEVMVGKSHAAMVLESGDFTISQSGVWDDSILCACCDNILGVHENYAHKVFSALRSRGSDMAWEPKVFDGVECNRLIRCICGILYKYSITCKYKGQISLGRYQKKCQDIAFSSVPISSDIDAFAFRPIRYAGDDGVFTYRAPQADRKYGLNMYRMMIGGMILFVKLDKRPIVDTITSTLLMRNSSDFIYRESPAQVFEEFHIPKSLVNSKGRLSTYLDKIDPR